MKTAIYSVTFNDAKSIDNFMAMTKDASIIFVMDIGSTDETVDLLQAYAEKDHRLKISELDGDASNKRLTAVNSLLYMVQSSFADIAIPLDPKVLFSEPDWMQQVIKLFQDSSINYIKASLNVLAIDDNQPYVSYIQEFVLAHRSIARCAWKHKVDPLISCVGEYKVAKVTGMRAIPDQSEVTVDYVQACVAEWDSNREDVYATYKALFALYLINSNDVSRFVSLSLESLNTEGSQEDAKYSIEILLLAYSITNDPRYLDLLSYYAANHYLASYYKATAEEDAEISIGYYLQALRNLSIGNNLSVYLLPMPEYKIRYNLAVRYVDLWEKTKAPYCLQKGLSELYVAQKLKPTCGNIQHDIEHILNMLKENSIDEEIKS